MSMTGGTDHDLEIPGPQELPVPFTVAKLQTLKTGRVRITVDVDPEAAHQAFLIFGDPGASGAMVRLRDDEAMNQTQLALARTANQAWWADLCRGDFFHTKEVLATIGSDEDYLDWIRQQPSALTGKGPCVAAHVRKVAEGAGTGIKPEHCAIPLTKPEHDLQHASGYAALGHGISLDWAWDQALAYRVEWASGELTTILDRSAYFDCRPREVLAWAEKHGLDHHISKALRERAR